MQHECDCGARYSNLDALYACQNNNHGWQKPPREAASMAIGESLDAPGKIEFTFNDANGEAFAVSRMLVEDVPEFISLIVSLSGYDEMGRDFAVAMRKARATNVSLRI